MRSHLSLSHSLGVCLSRKTALHLWTAPVLAQKVQSLGPRGKLNAGMSIQEFLTGHQGDLKKLESSITFGNQP